MRLWTCFKIIIGIIFLILFSFLYSLIRIPEIKMEEYSTNNLSLQYHIDNVDLGKNSVFVSGWILAKSLKQQPKYFQYRVILKNNDTKKCYSPKTYFVERPDVTKFFHDGENYNYSGFNSKVYMFMLPDAGKYEILLEYNTLTDKMILKTGKFFEKG